MELPRLEDHYDLGDELGRGGFGVVLAGRRRRDGAPAAIKLAHAEISDDLRVAREVERLRALRHPRLAELHGLFADAQGRQALVYEFIPGKPLDEVLEAGARVDPAALVRDLGAALDALHQAGLVHRDVKAPNVMVEPTGQFRLVDYGLLRGVDEGDTVTATGMIVGTIATMPPEQFMGERLTPQADLYSLACILFLAAEGRDAFPEANPGENLAAKKLGPPRVGDRDAFYRKALHPDPTRRFASGAALAAAFARQGQGAPLHQAQATQMLSSGEMTAPLPVAATPAAPQAAGPRAAAASPTSTQALPAALPEPPSRRPWVVAGALLCVGIGALMPGEAPLPPPTPPAASLAPPPAPPPPPARDFAPELRELRRLLRPDGVPEVAALYSFVLQPIGQGWDYRQQEFCPAWNETARAIRAAARTPAPDPSGARAAALAAAGELAAVGRDVGEAFMRATKLRAKLWDAGSEPKAAERPISPVWACMRDLAPLVEHGLAKDPEATPESRVVDLLLLATIGDLLVNRSTERGELDDTLEVASRRMGLVERAARELLPTASPGGRRLIYEALLYAPPPVFSETERPTDHKGNFRPRLACEVREAWRDLPDPPGGDPTVLVLDRAWRVRMTLLGMGPAVCGPLVPGPREWADDLFEHYAEVDWFLLSRLHDVLQVKKRALGDFQKSWPDRRLPRRLDELVGRIAQAYKRGWAPGPTQLDRWGWILDRHAWELEIARSWVVTVDGWSIFREGHDGFATEPFYAAVARDYEEAMESLEVVDGLHDALARGARLEDWPAAARARLRELDQVVVEATGDPRLRPLFPAAYIEPRPEPAVRPPSFEGPAAQDAAGWLGTAYAAMAEVGGSGAGADATRVVLAALGQAVKNHEVSAAAAAAMAAETLRRAAPLEDPVLRKQDEDWLVLCQLEPEDDWRPYLETLESLRAPPRESRKERRERKARKVRDDE